MRLGITCKTFVWFLCLSFLLTMSGVPSVTADTTGDLPFGEMISQGVVQFEAREDVWKEVESIHFPLFHGVRIRTGKGRALIVLGNYSQIDVGPDSLFSFQEMNQFHLLRGQVSFRVPSGADLVFRVGELSIGRVYPMQVSEGSVQLASEQSEIVGSMALRSNGSVTVAGILGPLSIENRDRAVLAVVSPGESVTIPSVTVSGQQKRLLAQVGEPEPSEAEPIEEPIGEPEPSQPPFGLESWTPVVVGGGLLAAGIAIPLAASGGGGSSDGALPPLASF
jgi:hypothetical protein